MQWMRTLLPILLFFSLIQPNFPQPGAVGPRPQPEPFSNRYPVEIRVDSAADLKLLQSHLYDIDSVRPLVTSNSSQAVQVTAYVNPLEAAWLSGIGLTATPINNPSRQAAALYGPGIMAAGAWPTYTDFVTRWQTLADAHPEFIRLVSIGTSVQGRAIYCLKITDHPDVEEDEPEVKFSAAIHGDETVGVELVTRLAELLAAGYGTDTRLTALVDELETWLCPLHNPDGYMASSRYNANGVNLNRDFPDPISDPVDTTAGRQPENQAFMQLGYAHRFVLGINYHGGALVVNYPWDNEPPVPPKYAPDNELFHALSVGYAALNQQILSGGFKDGVTVGWEWYSISGGMQDWAYNRRNELHVTIEVSAIKKPAFDEVALGPYWDNNREAMLTWMEQALTGARGLITDAWSGAPLDAQINTAGISKPVASDPEVGDYHRLLLPGEVSLTASADCHLPETASLTIPTTGAIAQDFALQPTGLQGTVKDDGNLPLSAWLQVAETGQVVNTDPLSGTYQLALCPGSYTLMVGALGYTPQTLNLTISDLQTMDIVLSGGAFSVVFLPLIAR